jgi:hypothetical protein
VSDVELLELPAPFEGLPYARRQLAFDAAEAMLPAAALLATLGQGVAELVLVNAAAHWLVKNGDGQPEHRTDTDTAGVWSGTTYGDVVATTLAKLAKPSGRTRRFPTIPT